MERVDPVVESVGVPFGFETNAEMAEHDQQHSESDHNVDSDETWEL